MNSRTRLWVREGALGALVEKYAEGKQAYFYGSRHVEDDLQDGILYPPDTPFGHSFISFTRSAQTAVRHALEPSRAIDFYSGGVLVLDRIALAQDYSVRRFSCPDHEGKVSKEDRVWDQPVAIKPYLIAVVPVNAPSTCRGFEMLEQLERCKTTYARSAAPRIFKTYPPGCCLIQSR